MSGVVRRREFGSDDTEVIEISNPKEVTYIFTTNSDNKEIPLGYFFNFYISKVELDGITVTTTGANPDVTIPTAGHHVIRIYLANVPSHNSDNYTIAITSFPFESIILPHNFGSKYGSNGTYKLNAKPGWSVVQTMYCLDETPFYAYVLINCLSCVEKIYIPKGSKQAYIANNYPVNKLVEVKYKYTL